MAKIKSALHHTLWLSSNKNVSRYKDKKLSLEIGGNFKIRLSENIKGPNTYSDNCLGILAERMLQMKSSKQF